MTPVQDTTLPGMDPNNLTNQLAAILRESFGVEPKAEDVATKSHIPTITTNSPTLDAIESPSFLSLVGRMIKPHRSMLTNLFYNMLKLVLMT
jgi:hypothetical protein